jgi:branched-chain amino acid transport system permease protein
MLIDLIEILSSGIINGSVYAVMAIGMALVYGVSKVFNFAYGSFYTFGGYLAWLLFKLDFGYPIVFIVSLPVLFICGLITERYMVKPLRKRHDWEMLVVMTTLGLALVMDNTFVIIFGSYVKSLPLLVEGNISFGNIVFSGQDIMIFVIAIVIMTTLIMFLNKNRMGMAVRAVASNTTGAQIVGIPKDKIFSYSFAISTVLVGVSGILLAPKFFISPMGGWGIMLKAWVITALGGMGSIKGSLVAAFVLGVVEAFVGWQLGLTYVWFVWFGILLFTLLVRPQGFFGTWG